MVLNTSVYSVDFKAMEQKVIVAMLNTSDNRKKATDILSGLTISELKVIGKQFHIHMVRLRKEAIVESIVEGTIGARLRTKTIRGY